MTAANVAAAPPRRRKQNWEEAEQRCLLQWAAVTPSGIARKRLSEFVIAIPNGSFLAGDARRRGMQMARLKSMGLKPGASDLLVALARGRYHGLWLEMKKRREDFSNPSKVRSAVSDEQREFGELVQLAGYAFAVAFGWLEAKRIIESYLAGAVTEGA